MNIGNPSIRPYELRDPARRRLKMNVPFNELAPNGTLLDELKQAIERVMKKGDFILGREVAAFEKDFAAFNKVKFCVGVASGTEAIALALMACGVGRGDEVITSDLTAYPTVIGIEMSGANPVLVDIDPETGLLDPDRIEEAVTEKTKAMVPVHLYGQCVGMDPLIAIANRLGLIVIEDCAQATGAKNKGRMAGSFGKASAFSFYPTKNLGCMGDGGAVCTNDEILFNHLVALRNLGQKGRFCHESQGLNSRLDEIQAAILNAKLKYVENWNEERNRIADLYTEKLDPKIAQPLHRTESNYHSFHLFVVKSNSRDNLQGHLSRRGIQSSVHYPTPCRRQPAFRKHWNGRYDKEWNSDRLARRVLSLPLYPGLSSDKIGYVAETINSLK